jgi:hypothetical protein
MLINRIASSVFDSFSDSGIIATIVAPSGTYVSNRVEIFEQVFSNQRLLDQLCRRIDDGCEPLIAQIDDFLVAACGLSAGFDNLGYVIMLLPSYTYEQSENFDFIEIILEQFSSLAALIEQNQRLRDLGEPEKTVPELAALSA